MSSLIKFSKPNVIIQPLAESDQHLKTLFNHPVSFNLNGFSASEGTLTYQVTHAPSFGSLNGTPPNLTYTPMPGYSEPDLLYFTVSNGTETGMPAQVLFDVTAFKTCLPNIKH